MKSWKPAMYGKFAYGWLSVTSSVMASSSATTPVSDSASPSSFSWPPSMKLKRYE
jgi:hypothetical protein